MNRNFIKMALIGLLLSASALLNVANASLITADGSIDDGTQVDVWNIEILSNGTFIFDVLAFETSNTDFFGNGQDNDSLDSYIYLFANNLNGALMGADDDGGLGNDGSIYSFDSYMSLALNMGSYVLAIGDYNLNETEARAAFNGNNAADTSLGRYTISISSDADFSVGGATPPSAIPEPSTFAIFALGLVGLFARKIKN